MQKKPVAIDDFCALSYLSELSFSPNGQAAAFVVGSASREENCYHSAIWLWEQGKLRRLTTGGSEAGPLWLNDEELLFPGDRKKAHKPAPGQAITVYNRINIHGGEAQEAFTVPLRCSRLQPIGAGEYLLIGQYDHNAMDVSALSGEEKEAAIAQIEEEKDYEVFDELPFWSNGRGVVNKKRDRLYLFRAESGELTLLSPAWMNVSSYDYDKDSDRVVFFGSDYQWMDERKDDLYIRAVHGTEQVQVKLERKYGVSAALWVDGEILFAASDGARYGTAQNPSQYLADPATGDFKEIARLDCSMHSSVGSDCRHGSGKARAVANGCWYFSSTRGSQSYIMKMDKEGRESRVSPAVKGSIDCFTYHEGKFLYVAMRENGLQELYAFTEGSDHEEKISSFNDAYLAEHAVSPVKPLNFVDADGVEIEGWVLEPKDYDPSKRYPAILDVHGGPKTVYGEVFFHEMQYWASQGYFVFFCNPRGGDGRGDAFADIAGPNYGVRDYNDLMEFCDKVLEAYPQIDPARVGMTGGSYGGFMANWIVGHTDRFAAVASQRSISNFISKCLTTDIGYYHNLSAVQSDPWTSPEEMWNRSPLKYADRCKTPTLFIQSDEDYRCWMCDAIQMFTALRMHGCPTRLCLFHGENHELSRNGKPKHRVRRLKEITDWFDSYLKA